MFWQGRSVLVTGHTGFKGSWLALWLSELGARVHGYALAPPTTPSLFAEARIAERLASHELGDLRDRERLARAVARCRPEVVFHLAAQPLVRRSYAEPLETFETNVIGTAALLEALRRCEPLRVIQVITSDKCYENREWDYAYRENDPLGGHDPYSASKGAQELVAASWRRAFFAVERPEVSLATCRAGNVVGGGDWAEDRILPDCVRALERGEEIVVRNPHAVRPWQHVLEPLGGYLRLAREQWRQPVEFAEGWNFGPGHAAPVAVGRLVERVCAGWGNGKWSTPAPAAAQPHESRTLQLEITKAVTRLGWAPRYGALDAIDLSVAWYRERARQGAGFDAAAACLAQLRDYRAHTPERTRPEADDD